MSPSARLFVDKSGIPTNGIHKNKVRRLYAKRFAKMWQKSENESTANAAFVKPNCHDMCYTVRKFAYGEEVITVNPEMIYIDPMYNADGRFAYVRVMVERNGVFVPDERLSLSELGLSMWVDESVTTRLEVVKSGKCAIAYTVTS